MPFFRYLAIPQQAWNEAESERASVTILHGSRAESGKYVCRALCFLQGLWTCVRLHVKCYT